MRMIRPEDLARIRGVPPDEPAVTMELPPVPPPSGHRRGHEIHIIGSGGGFTRCNLPREPRREVVSADDAAFATCQACIDAPDEPVRHPAHLCLTCSGTIYPTQPEIKVENTRGFKAGTHRFRHASEEDCRKGAMGRPRYTRRTVYGGLVGRRR